MNDDYADEYGRNDPETQERELRRQEREAKRRKKQGDTAEQPASPPDPAPAPKEPAPVPEDPARSQRARPGSASPAAKTPMPREQRARPGSASPSAKTRRPGPTAPVRLPSWPRVALVAVLAVAALFLWMLFQPFHGEGSGEVPVTVPKGASGSQIATLLDDQGVIGNKTLFRIRLSLSGHSGDIEAGNYRLAKDMSYGAAISALSTPPKVDTATVVVPEGFSRDQIAKIAGQDGLQGNYKEATVKSKLLNPRQYGGKKAKDLEGFLFPATYEVKPGSSVDLLVDQQLKAFKQQIKGVNMSYAKKKNLTTYDVLTIAAMVEREVQVAKERPLVAAVIYNRLHDKMPLGIDATVRFATGNYDRPLTQSELNSDSPYNTRKFAGLPPGPIGNPGIDSIKAAARPANVKYLFYVVKPGTCGEHSFANTEAEFNKLVAKYNKARREAGGKSPTDCKSG